MDKHKQHQPAARRPSALGNHFPNASLKRSTASRMLARLPNADARTKPSPAGPKPEPGVVTMLHFCRMSVNTSLRACVRACVRVCVFVWYHSVAHVQRP